MVEIIKHLFGFCGEGHPSLLCLLGLTPFIYVLKGYILRAYRMFKLIVKSCLRQFY